MAARNAPVTPQAARCATSGNDATGDPVAPTGPHGARVREVAALLATGYIRGLLSARNGLARSPADEPCCDQVVNGRRTPSPGHHGEHRP